MEVEQAAAAISEGYAAEDDRAVARARKLEEQAVAKVRDLQHRLNGAEIRVERAQRTADTFAVESAGRLLAEREDAARDTAAALTRSVNETVKLAKEYKTERQRVSELVSQAAPGAGAINGPAATHAWERELDALDRAVRETSEIPAPLPRWLGRAHRERQDQTHRRLRLQRRKKPRDERSEEAA